MVRCAHFVAQPLSTLPLFSALCSFACAAQGQASDIAIHAKEILKMRDLLNSLYVKHTGQEKQKVGGCAGSRQLANFCSCWHSCCCVAAAAEALRARGGCIRAGSACRASGALAGAGCLLQHACHYCCWPSHSILPAPAAGRAVSVVLSFPLAA